MGDFADDLSMDYDAEFLNEDEHKEMCYCGRMVTDKERVFDGEKTVCIYCQYEQ